MKSYNQFMYEVYDLQESGQIELSENPFKGMADKFQSGLRSYSQSPIGKNLNKAYSAVSRSPIINNPVTRAAGGFMRHASGPIIGTQNAIDRVKKRGQDPYTRAIPTAAAQTIVGLKAGSLGAAKGAAACALGGPLAAGACGLAGGAAGFAAGYYGTGAAMDKVYDSNKPRSRNPNKFPSSRVGTAPLPSRGGGKNK